MSKTIEDLVECCQANVIPPFPVLADYFGWDNLHNFNEGNICLILGLYIKMLNSWNINTDIIEKAFINNELDNLIHDTYKKQGKTGFNQMFCDKNTIIRKTNTLI
jgi:hypothetical protein